MAGDWIKMRHNLETDPDVLRIAEIVGIDRFSVVGRLHMIWSWADQHSIDGCAISATTSFLDELVCCAGFCKALRSVGWLDGRDWQLSFPNFDRHNGETAKKRAQAKKTMAKRRASSATNVARNAQPEKRREEKSNNTPTHTARGAIKFARELDAGELSEHWSRWCDFRMCQDGRELDSIRGEQELMRLSGLGVDKARQDIEFSIRKGAKSLLDSDNDFEANFNRGQGAGTRRKAKTAAELMEQGDA